MNRTQAVVLSLLTIALTGCSIVFGSGFEPDVVIPTTNYRIDNFRCESQPGLTNVDGESVEDLHWFVVGNFVNPTDNGSANYEIRANVVFSDGTMLSAKNVVFPLASGDSEEFSAFITAAIRLEDPNATVTECSDVMVFDSVLNH